MAKITDPDNLNQGTEVTIDTTGKTIALSVAGNLSTDGVELQTLYSFLKEEWKNDSALIKFNFPMEAITPEQFEFINGWTLLNTSTINLIRDGGFAVRNTSGNVEEEYIGFVTLGSVGATDQIYYQQVTDGSPTNVVLTGPSNQCIKVFGDASNGNFDYRTFFKCFVREEAKSFAQSDLNAIGTTSVTYQVYRFPLSNATDLSITHTDTEVQASPYLNIDVTYHATPQTRTIGGVSYNFDVIIEGDNKSKEQIYEKIQYVLRQNSDIDEGTGTVIGQTTTKLLTFVGDTLVTSNGIFIDNFASTDTNAIDFYDNAGTVRRFPFVAAGVISFNSNLVNDSDAVYRMFFTNNFGTSSALLVDDNSSVDISGDVGGQSSVSFTFDYDNNVQGGRSLGTDADVTIVAIGLSTGQYVVATSTITRSNANSISLVSALERNYENV
jgi:hypothetical protein